MNDKTRRLGNTTRPPQSSTPLRTLVASRYRLPVAMAAAGILAAPFLVGCDTAPTDTVAGQTYCVVEAPNDEVSVVDDDNCDNSSGGGHGFWLVQTSHVGAHPGAKLPSSNIIGGSNGKIPAHDANARANAGILAKGNGTGVGTVSRGGLGASSGGAKAGGGQSSGS